MLTPLLIDSGWNQLSRITSIEFTVTPAKALEATWPPLQDGLSWNATPLAQRVLVARAGKLADGKYQLNERAQTGMFRINAERKLLQKSGSR